MSSFNMGLDGYIRSSKIGQKQFTGSLEFQASTFDRSTYEALTSNSPDLVCLSHLRWDLVYQRPQHLLSRCAAQRRTFFIEEPIFESSASWRLETSRREGGVWVIVPHLPSGMSQEMVAAMMQSLIDELFEEYGISSPILWYYTPIALSFTQHLEPLCVVYDCMNELTALIGASQAPKDWEAELFKRADVVFTDGQSLYESKQHQHSNIHAFPSDITDRVDTFPAQMSWDQTWAAMMQQIETVILNSRRTSNV